jgi:hypothetical protein
MKILVTLQQEVEYDSEEYLTGMDDYPEIKGLHTTPRHLDISSSIKKPTHIESIQAKDLRIGDVMSEIDGYLSYDGRIVSITEIECVPDQNTPK